jgi:hypothetical protein
MTSSRKELLADPLPCHWSRALCQIAQDAIRQVLDWIEGDRR